MFFKYPKLRWCKCKCKWWRWWWCGCCCESVCCKTTLLDLFGEHRVSSILVVVLLLISTWTVEFGCMLIPLGIMAASLPVWLCCWFIKNSFTFVNDFEGLRACEDLLDADGWFVDESARCDDDDVEVWLSTVFERLIIKPAVERLKAWIRLDAERLTPDVSASIVSPYFVFLLVAIKRCRRYSSHSVCDTISFFFYYFSWNFSWFIFFK